MSKKPRYTPDEDEALTRLFHRGSHWGHIALHLGRPLQSVRHRAYKLGLRRYEDGNKPQESVCRKTVHNRRYQEKFPEKRAAHKQVERALLNGSLKKERCSACGAGEAQAHHDDYSRPLDVRWLCQSCHSSEHRRCAA